MLAVRVGMRRMRATLAIMLAGSGLTALAQPADSHLQLDVGTGHEAQSSPVFQLSPEGNILYLDGQQGLRGSHLRTSLQGSANWIWEQGISTALAVDATVKRSPSTPDLDFMSFSVQPAIHWPWGNSSVGLGINLLSYDVGGHHFRDSTGIQVDWTQSDEHSLWGVVAEVSSYTHATEFSEMDAKAASLVVLRQWTNPFPGIEGLDLSAIIAKEVNDHGFHDLSSHSAMVTGSLHWTWLGADCSFGHSWRQAIFEDNAFAGESVRTDRTVMTDLGAQWSLSATHSIRLEYNAVRNASSTRLYDNTFEQWSVILRSVW
jgi:hypothetical protein